jgi:ABC-2 type transport system ATP-binding protein
VSSAINVQDVVMRFPQQQGWKAVFKREPGKLALDHVALTVNEGEIFGLLGPNGAGKTTLVKVLCTLTIPTAGKATVLGMDTSTESLQVRRRVGVVYGDERTFFWRLSALENLLFYASLHGLSSREARIRSFEALETVGLSNSANVRMHHYSSGMRQRASIARGLINNPELLIMDEPTRTLDPVAAKEVRSLVKSRVASQGRTVLIATNIMAEAEYLCDRLAFINHGRVVMTGSIEEMRDVIETDAVYEMTVSNVGSGYLRRLERIDGVVSVHVSATDDQRQTIKLNARRDATVVPDAVRALVESGADIWSCARRDLTVEEMFSALARVASVPEQRELISA